MPYVSDEYRIQDHWFKDSDLDLTTPGNLNYYITRLCMEYLDGRKGINYQKVNEIVGVLECAKSEFIRRVLNPYENIKEFENGDVYE